MQFDWTGQGFMFGRNLDFFQITTEGVPLVFVIHEGNQSSNEPFTIERINKNINSINITEEIYDEIENVYISKTDRDFRMAYKRSYYLLKFVTKGGIITIGAYTDNNKEMKSDNLYILCDRDYINILAKMELVNSTTVIENTAFKNLNLLFDKKELAQELLRK